MVLNSENLSLYLEGYFVLFFILFDNFYFHTVINNIVYSVIFSLSYMVFRNIYVFYLASDGEGNRLVTGDSTAGSVVSYIILPFKSPVTHIIL